MTYRELEAQALALNGWNFSWLVLGVSCRQVERERHEVALQVWLKTQDPPRAAGRPRPCMVPARHGRGRLRDFASCPRSLRRFCQADLMQLATDVGSAPIHIGAVLVLATGSGFNVAEVALRQRQQRDPYDRDAGRIQPPDDGRALIAEIRAHQRDPRAQREKIIDDLGISEQAAKSPPADPAHQARARWA